MLKQLAVSLFEYFMLILGLGLLAFICLSWSIFAVILNGLLPEHLARPLGRGIITAGFRCYINVLSLSGACRFDLNALDTLRDEKSLILAPNHPSLLDAVLILSRLSDVGCVLKSELMDNILFGAGSRLARYIRNDSPRSMIRQSVDDLKRGSHLLLFPEGTRTTTLPVNPFKGSIGLISTHAGAPVQTIFIEANSPFLGKDWPLFRRPNLPIIFRIRLGQRFDPPDNSRLFNVELEHYFAAELLKSKHNLQ